VKEVIDEEKSFQPNKELEEDSFEQFESKAETTDEEE
jgi:hypothetical protein